MSVLSTGRFSVLVTVVTLTGSGCAVEEPTMETEAPAGLQEEAQERRKIQLESTRAPRMSAQTSTEMAPAEVARLPKVDAGWNSSCGSLTQLCSLGLGSSRPHTSRSRSSA